MRRVFIINIIFIFIENRLVPAIETTVHILCLPPSAKSTDVCIQWYQESVSSGSKFKGCWAIDNIIISNVADRPKIVEESFDPIDPGNFLFFPGGIVKVFNQHFTS